MNCFQNPNGVPNCLAYNSNVNCTKCQNNYELNSSNCIAISVDYLVKNCLEYTNNICTKCTSEFILNNNSCLFPEALNCKTPKSLKECLNCFDNFTLQNNGDRVDCVFLSIPNCLVVDD
jgi:hypothetical protein